MIRLIAIAGFALSVAVSVTMVPPGELAASSLGSRGGFEPWAPQQNASSSGARHWRPLRHVGLGGCPSLGGPRNCGDRQATA
jgi:hypothetical protein